MKKIVKLLTCALLLLSMALALVSCGGGGVTPTTDNSKDIQVLVALLRGSRPATATSTITYTYSTGDVYVSTYTLNTDGTCTYRIEEPREFDVSNPTADPIKVTEGTMTATEYNGSLSMANFNPTKDNLSYFAITTASNGNKLYTTSIPDANLPLFFGKVVKISNVSVVYEVNSANKICKIDMTFLTQAQATATATTTFTY